MSLRFRELIIVLLSLSLFSFTITSATEQPPYAHIVNVNYPSIVNAGETFNVTVEVEYWLVDPIEPNRQLLVSINEADDRTWGDPYPSLTPDLAHVDDQLPQGKGTKTYNLTLTSPKMNETWHLVAETYIVWAREFRLSDKRNFDITILKTPVQIPTGPDILVNGGFESDFEGWERYSYGEGVADLSDTVFHQGNYALVTSSRVSPTRPDRPNGGGVYQVIERPDLTFDMNFSFWVYPMFVIRESTTDVRTWIAFHTNERTFKIYYYVSWRDKSALLNKSDVTFFLLENCRLGVWNFVGRNLKSDFEARFGSSSQYRLLKMEVYLDLTAGVFSMLSPFAYWDEVAITSTLAPAADFQMSSDPASVSVSQGGSGSSTMKLQSLNGFSNAVTLSWSWLGSAPSDVTVDLPTSLTPPADGVGTATLTVTAAATATIGDYTLKVNGTSGALTHTANVPVSISAAATTTTSTTTTTSSPTPTPSGCLVATATYGSELSPEVQFLRGFRDQQVMKTSAGREFMTVFNAWYYSFSPDVAGFIANNPPVRAAMKILLYPLVGLLHLSASAYAAFSFNRELAVCVAGLLASGLIGIVYFSPLALAVLAILRRTRRLSVSMRNVVPLAYIWAANTALLVLSVLISSSAAMRATSTIFALTTIALTSVPIALKVLQKLP